MLHIEMQFIIRTTPQISVEIGNLNGLWRAAFEPISNFVCSGNSARQLRSCDLNQVGDDLGSVKLPVYSVNMLRRETSGTVT